MVLGSSLLLPIVTSEAEATEFDAGVVMQKMTGDERAWYIQGVVEGLAYSRYERDNQHVEGEAKVVTGMNCIYDWFYEKPHTIDLIYAAFGRFPNYTPAAIINNLVKQTCSE